MFKKDYCKACTLSDKLQEAEFVLSEIAKTMEVCYQQGKIDTIAHTCLDAKKVYDLLISYKPQTF